MGVEPRAGVSRASKASLLLASGGTGRQRESPGMSDRSSMSRARCIRDLLLGLAAGAALFAAGCFGGQETLTPKMRETFLRAFELRDQGDYRGAIEKLKEAANLSSADRWKGFAQYCISQLLEQTGESAAAQAWLSRAKSRLGPLSEVAASAGECYMRLQLLEDARREFRAALKGRLLGKRKAMVIYELGLVCTDLGYFDEAQRNFKRILVPDFPEGYRGYALLLEKAGQFSEARAMWEAYLKYAPDGRFASEAREHLSRL